MNLNDNNMDPNDSITEVEQGKDMDVDMERNEPEVDIDDNLEVADTVDMEATMNTIMKK